MPKAILEFNLPEERDDHKLAINAVRVSCDLYEFSEWLRRKYKHVDPSSDEAYKEYEEIRDKFYEMMGEHID